MKTFHWSTAGSGLSLIALLMPWALAPLVGHFADQRGPRLFTSVAFVLSVPAYVGLAFVSENSTLHKFLLCALLVVLGFCSAALLTCSMADICTIMDALEKESPGVSGPNGGMAQAIGLNNMAYAAGMLLGPVVLGGVADAKGWGFLSFFCAGFCAISAGFMMAYSGRKT